MQPGWQGLSLLTRLKMTIRSSTRPTSMRGINLYHFLDIDGQQSPGDEKKTNPK